MSAEKTTVSKDEEKDSQKFTSVTEMVEASNADEKTKKDTISIIASKFIVKQLIAKRKATGITRSQLAKKMNRSKKYIRRIEGSIDRKLKVGDVLNYAKALDRKINFVIT